MTRSPDGPITRCLPRPPLHLNESGPCRYCYHGSVLMYDDFYVIDRWTRQQVHCMYQALIVAVATRHADAIDIKFLAGGRPVWIALPHPAWVEYNRLTGKVITDPLAVQTAGRYLKTAIESGLDAGREIYTLTVEETLGHIREVLIEMNAPRDHIPQLEAASS